MYSTWGEIDLNLFVESPDGNMSSCEPLIIREEFVNVGQKDAYILQDRFKTMRVSLWNSKEKDLASTILEQPPGHGGVHASADDIFLSPGGRKTRRWVISALHQFKIPGTYTVRIQRFSLRPKETAVTRYGRKVGFPAKIWPPVPNSFNAPNNREVVTDGTVTFRVLPYNPKRLQARGEELWQSFQGYSGSFNTEEERLAFLAKLRERDTKREQLNKKALYTVCDDVALPYLEHLALASNNVDPFLAMRRIGTQRAKQLVRTLATRKDYAGSAAREAMTLSLDPPDLYKAMGGDW